MARCRSCGSSGWRTRTNSEGVCRTCSSSIDTDAKVRVARIKESLVYIRCTRDPETVLPLCDAAIEHARALLDYETRRLAEISPRPSALLAMLEAKRMEVAEQIRSAREKFGRVTESSEVADPPGALAADGEAGEPSALPQGAQKGDSPPRSATARVGTEDTEAVSWWAWDVLETATADLDPERLVRESRDNRRAVRESVHCLVLLEPGGIRGTLENLSTGGLFLHASRLRPPGSRVRLLLSTAQGPMAAEGVVRWVKKGGSGDRFRPAAGMGIEFTRVSAELRAFLSRRFPSLGPIADEAVAAGG